MRLREVGQAWSGLEEARIVVFADQGGHAPSAFWRSLPIEIRFSRARGDERVVTWTSTWTPASSRKGSMHVPRFARGDTCLTDMNAYLPAWMLGVCVCGGGGSSTERERETPCKAHFRALRYSSTSKEGMHCAIGTVP